MKAGKYSKILALVSILISSTETFGQTSGIGNVNDTNYITVEKFTSKDGASSVRDIVCYDGLGYPVQEISYAATQSGKAIVRPIVYDSLRRDDAVSYLPFAESLSYGSYVTNAVERQRTFYQSLHDDSYGYSEKEYESSPSGRVISAMNAGKEYRSSNKKGAYSYAANSDADAVVRFAYEYPTGDITTASIISRGKYLANTLEKVTYTDEDGGRTETFTDGRGRLICTRQYLGGSARLETHYVYDLKDSLVCVIQPKGIEALGTLSVDSRVSFGSDLAKHNFFLYRYDGQGRIIESQVPDGGVSEYVYDIRGRLMVSATTAMLAHGLYKVTDYDVLDRVTGEVYVKFGDGVTADDLRGAVSGEGSLPSYTKVKRTYKASYYDGTEELEVTIEEPRVVFDISDQLSVSAQSRMIVAETAEDFLVSKAEFVSLPEGKTVGNLTAVRKANSVTTDAGTSGTSSGALIGKKIYAKELALKFTEDEIATYTDRDQLHLKGLLKEESVSSVPGIDGEVFRTDTLMRVRRYYYDSYGRVIQVRELDSDGWAACYSTKYDFAGNIIGTRESHTSPAGKNNTVKTLRTLDRRGVVLSEEIYADGVLMTKTAYSYDELMRPVGKATGSVSETFAYDIRGWQTGHTAGRGSDSIYSETLKYMNPTAAGSTARWTGLISESVTQQYTATENCDLSARTDSYVYDAMGRLTSSNQEDNIRYDANGNVTALRRLSATGTTIANLSMSYAGNRLESVTNTGIEDRGTFTYAYDPSGNLTSDSRNCLEIHNNVLNLPMRVEQSSTGTSAGTMGGTMTYTYLGDGTRVAARAGASSSNYAGKRYRGSFVYDVTAGGVQNIESVAVSTGRLIALTGTNGAVSFESDGFITDHLGNVALVVNLSASGGTQTDNVILEQNEYTPFGTKLSVSGLKSQAANRWRYAGKEEQDIAGMNLRLLDFGARYYDSFTCRWNAVDPLAGKYPGLSPYNYCAGDPVNLTDPTGRSIGDFFNLWGKLIGSDGKDDGKKYLVLDNEEAKAVKTNTKNGTPTSKSNVPSAIEVPSNEVIDKCDEALKASDVNEHGLVVATDGTTSSMIEGDPRSVVLGPGYEELDAQGKETSHDVHVHPYSLKLLGNDKYEGSSSKPSRADRTYRRVKEENGAVNQPSWVIATVPTNVTADGNAEKTVKITIYDSSSDDGIATADWNQFKRAAKKLNK